MENSNLDNNNENESVNNDKLIEDILNAKNKLHNDKEELTNSVTETDANEVLDDNDAGEASEIEQDDKVIDDDDSDDTIDDSDKSNKRKKKKKRSKGKHIFALILILVIITIAVTSAILIITVGKDALGIDKPENAIQIVVPKGATTSEIADLLYTNDVIEYPLVFKAFSKLQKADALYKIGTHTLNTNMAYETIINELQKSPPQETVDVTFPEGYTIVDCAKLLEESGVCKADDFIVTFNSASFGFNFESQVSNSSLKFYKMEGYLFPDTYTFYKNTAPEIVAKKIYANFAEKVNPNLLGRMKELNLTLDQTITLASIVQAEAPEFNEMKNVASVFYNRLNNKDKFPLLQSDTTTKYVNEVIKKNIPIENEAMYTAYDTYKGAGLPPGPICNPGIDAINAVLSPSESNYYYFCSNLTTREFFYAKTNAEHEKNLVKAGLK